MLQWQPYLHDYSILQTNTYIKSITMTCMGTLIRLLLMKTGRQLDEVRLVSVGWDWDIGHYSTLCNIVLSYNMVKAYLDGLVQDCSNSSALAMELLQSCTKQVICITCNVIKNKNRKLCLYQLNPSTWIRVIKRQLSVVLSYRAWKCRHLLHISLIHCKTRALWKCNWYSTEMSKTFSH